MISKLEFLQNSSHAAIQEVLHQVRVGLGRPLFRPHPDDSVRPSFINAVCHAVTLVADIAPSILHSCLTQGTNNERSVLILYVIVTDGKKRVKRQEFIIKNATDSASASVFFART